MKMANNRRKNRYAKKASQRPRSPARVAAAAMLILLFIFPIFTQAQAVGLPVLPTTLMGIAFVAVLAVIAVAALVLMLSGLIASPNAMGWARFQVYEGLLSIVLILIFLAFIYLFTLNPNSALQSVGLLPNGGEFPCGSAPDIFAISTCDIATFNRYAFGMFEALFFVTMFMGYTPGLQISAQFATPTLDSAYTASGGVGSLIPLSIENSLSFAFDMILALELLNQVQVLLLSGSLMWLAFFVTLGLIVRTFGFMRTFGGAMVALGLGLGLVYPLVTAITYGFIDNTILNSLGCVAGTVGCIFQSPSTVPGLAYDILMTFIAIIPALFGGPALLPTGPWVFAIAMVVAGLTFMGFLNFTIVDAFIVDFSRAIGERMNFMSLLIGLI